MDPALNDIQEVLKKHDLLFWLCCELSGTGLWMKNSPPQGKQRIPQKPVSLAGFTPGQSLPSLNKDSIVYLMKIYGEFSSSVSL